MKMVRKTLLSGVVGSAAFCGAAQAAFAGAPAEYVHIVLDQTGSMNTPMGAALRRGGFGCPNGDIDCVGGDSADINPGACNVSTHLCYQTHWDAARHTASSHVSSNQANGDLPSPTAHNRYFAIFTFRDGTDCPLCSGPQEGLMQVWPTDGDRPGGLWKGHLRVACRRVHRQRHRVVPV